VKLGQPRLWAPLALLGSVILAAFTRPAVLRLLHGNLPRFPYACQPLPAPAYDALAARPLWAKTSLAASPDVKLNGLVRRPKVASAPWVLFFPGNDASQLTAGQELLERLAGPRDWGLVVYADRGYDSSGGTPSADTLREDGYGILNGVLTSEGIPPERLHVVAFSMGGYVAAAGVGAAAREHKVIASFSTLSAVERMEMVHSMLLARVAMGDLIETLPLLDDVPGPVLVLHGTEDATLNVSQGRAIAARLGSRAEFRELRGVGHLDMMANEGALEAVRGMIEKYSRR